MLRLQLFRVKVLPPRKDSSASARFSPQRALAETIRSKPSAEIRPGYTWHIGNVSKLDSSGVYFAVGRTTRSTIETFDATSGNFVETEFQTAPYTHALLDTALEVVAIAPKSQLAPTTAGIAEQFAKLLNSTVEVSGVTGFEVAAISNPRQFIQLLRQGHAIRRFSLTFSLPNPWDVNKDFQRPMEKLLQQADGSAGRTSIVGDSLDPKVLTDLTRSAVATGNQAEASIKKTPTSKTTRRHATGAVTIFAESELLTHEQRRLALKDVRAAYAEVRGSAGRRKS